MARPRSDVTIAMLEVFGRQSEPMTWRTVAEELARRGVIGAALAPGELRMVRHAVCNACKRGKLVSVGATQGTPGKTRPQATYRIRRNDEPTPTKASAIEERSRVMALALKAWNTMHG